MPHQPTDYGAHKPTPTEILEIAGRIKSRNLLAMLDRDSHCEGRHGVTVEMKTSRVCRKAIQE